MFLKLSKAAEILDVHKDTVRRYIRKGVLQAKQLPSGHWRVDEASVLGLLNKSIDTEVDSLLEGLI